MTTASADRIAQFEKMAHDDPENDMAHFSLGSAYLQAGRHEEAAKSFERCIAINAQMSKAYQLAGQALINAGATERAAELLTKGYEVASRRGDRLPMTAMAELLKSINKPVPEVKPASSVPAASGGTFIDHKTGRPGTKLAAPPFRGPVGQWIFEHISAETWRAWIGQGTKVINELRLDLSREHDQAVYDQHMMEYLGVDPSVAESKQP